MKRLFRSAALAVLAISSTIYAQEPTADQIAVPHEEVPPGPPVYSGRDRATGVASRQTGAIFELASGARLVVPAGLPIGTRTLNFGTARGRLAANEIGQGFRALGAAFSFDAAIDATRAPVELSIATRRFRAEAGKRLVIAVESPGICDATHRTSIGGSLCSTWEVLDAHYDEGAQRIVATIPTPSGHRFVFGWLPLPAAPAPQRPVSSADDF